MNVSRTLHSDGSLGTPDALKELLQLLRCKCSLCVPPPLHNFLDHHHCFFTYFDAVISKISTLCIAAWEIFFFGDLIL